MNEKKIHNILFATAGERARADFSDFVTSILSSHLLYKGDIHHSGKKIVGMFDSCFFLAIDIRRLCQMDCYQREQTL